MKSYAKSKLLIAAAFLAAIAVAAGSGIAQDAAGGLKALGGGQVLDRINPPPEMDKQRVSDGGFGRAYRQQPPLIPHRIDGYQITPTNNACMNCHDWPANVQAKAPKASETHYVDRQGVRLDRIAGTRYFCQQCHVPQEDARPLVNNTFKNATEVK